MLSLGAEVLGDEPGRPVRPFSVSSGGSLVGLAVTTVACVRG